ncbi:hypothetical protein HaLaN_14121 [Haematococcus lacustris]|uniref:Uncharacterized protein n=1 Tax=Haematococcus lacustris TaxID=44745 RepID=A0A699ZNM6_HAELA|nr:hypothetical protein HaLaN_14121 [Haematococcus lacustris]
MPAQALTPLQANNGRSEGLNGRPNDDRSSKSRVVLCCAEVHSQLRVIASPFVLRIFLTCLVGYPTPGLQAWAWTGILSLSQSLP